MTNLHKLLSFAMLVTQSGRGLIVNDGLQILHTQTEEDTPLIPDVVMLANIREAINQGEALICNNIIADASSAPDTNTNFANLRIGVVLPVVGVGALYMDKRVRSGVITKPVVDRLMQLIQHISQHQQWDTDAEALQELYAQM